MPDGVAHLLERPGQPGRGHQLEHRPLQPAAGAAGGRRGEAQRLATGWAVGTTVRTRRVRISGGRLRLRRTSRAAPLSRVVRSRSAMLSP